MLLATGMRWGEAAGLPVRAVNFDHGTVSIMQVLRKENFKWKVIVRPKTKDGDREIPVPAQVMKIIEARCGGRDRDAFVFTAPKGGHWRYAVFHDDRWKKIRALAEAKGLRKCMTMYGLRHFLLTWLGLRRRRPDGAANDRGTQARQHDLRHLCPQHPPASPESQGSRLRACGS